MTRLFANAAIIVYFSAAACLLAYGLNCYVMIALFRRRRRETSEARRALLEAFSDPMLRDDLPVVTTQVAVFNEFNVAERAIRAACAMRYAPGKHEVQVLDDSTDETREIVDRVAEEMRQLGHDVKVLRREVRTGFKAGALDAGLRVACGELLAVFDADFVPPQDYLLRTVPFLAADPGVGLVQARWGHLNRRQSLLTRVQAVGIDGHFMVEQSARNWNGLFMNFNGTAGIWRKSAIEGGGGWHWDTLTEDMDLSYRVQLAGWRASYVPEVVVPAEVPEDVRAFKNQQFRWAKGSIQTAMKLLPALIRSDVSLFKKIQAFFHVTHYMVHPMMLTLATLALPVLLVLRLSLAPLIFTMLAAALALAMLAPSMLYVVSQRAAYPDDWRRRLCYLPFLVVLGVGIAVSNTRAVIEALLGMESAFVRTPKRGDVEGKRYRISFPWLSLVEIALGGYCAWTLGYYLTARKYLVGPFLAAYAAGFLFVGLLTLVHSLNAGGRRSKG